MLRSGNPSLDDSTFLKESYPQVGWWAPESSKMTMDGVINKSALLLSIATISAFFGIFIIGFVWPLVASLWVIGVVMLIWINVTRNCNPVVLSTYAVVQGLLVGSITFIFEYFYPGIALQAVAVTFCIFAGILGLYKSGLIPWNENMRIAVAGATLGVFILYIVSFFGIFAGFQIPYIFSSGPIGILWSLFVIALCSFNIVSDFDFIENGVESGAPKELEWRAAFGLLVCLLWLYVEVLYLLAKLRE